jgi:cytoplasmic iron level regulating protein YaaA (DUF328/UPF0246 family)
MKEKLQELLNEIEEREQDDLAAFQRIREKLSEVKNQASDNSKRSKNPRFSKAKELLTRLCT